MFINAKGLLSLICFPDFGLRLIGNAEGCSTETDVCIGDSLGAAKEWLPWIRSITPIRRTIVVTRSLDLTQSLAPLLIMLGFVLALSGCGGVDTSKPVYEGLLPTGVVPRQSIRLMPEVRKAPGVSVVLSQSTRETLQTFRDVTTPGLNYPVDEWVLKIAQPPRELSHNAKVLPDLTSIPTGNWTVVVHWATLHKPFVIGGTIEYRVLDPELAQVAVFRAEETGNCDTVSFNMKAVYEHNAKCYDQFLSRLIDKAGRSMVEAARK